MIFQETVEHKKGLPPEGVFVRQGYSYEDMCSINQSLTFNAVAKEFTLRNIDFGIQQMRTLKLLDKDGIYSNLAMLLSDQCIHTIKLAVFQGTDQSVFRDRKEFTGSLMQQMNDAYNMIDFHNQTHAEVEKLLRIDVRDYPEIAIRESLLNMIIHRDYSFRASALISIYSDRIEFVSVGGLLPGIDINDVMVGLSVCRNQNLANVFYRLQLIEAYGTGLMKIMNAYETVDKKPIIETTKNAFKITLPNINCVQKTIKTIPLYISNTQADIAYDYEHKILDHVRKHNMITRNEAQILLNVSSSTASRLLRQMVTKQLLIQQGKARNTVYTLPKE